MEHAKLFSYRTFNYKLSPYQKPFDDMSRSSIENGLPPPNCVLNDWD
jgi:hypothetical protein